MEQPGTRLKEWIGRSKLTQRDAAKLLGFDQTFLSQIVNGHRSPGLANAVRIERVTGIAVESWLPQQSGELDLVAVGSGRNRRNGKG